MVDMDGIPLTAPSLVVPRAPRSAATALSHAARRAGGGRRVLSAVARASLTLAIAAMTTGCLITDPPQFTPPVHKRPLLDASLSLPDPNQVLVVDDVEIAKGTQTQISFSATLTTQDDPDVSSAFHRTTASLYIDLGIDTHGAEPWEYRFTQELEGGATYEDPPRPVTFKWRPEERAVTKGCHTITLLAAHRYDEESKCPSCADDYDFITWQVLRCDRSASDCDKLPVDCDKLEKPWAPPPNARCDASADGGAQ